MELYREHPEQAGKVAGEGPDAIPIAAWTAVARILLNLDETITKD